MSEFRLYAEIKSVMEELENMGVVDEEFKILERFYAGATERALRIAFSAWTPFCHGKDDCKHYDFDERICKLKYKHWEHCPIVKRARVELTK